MNVKYRQLIEVAVYRQTHLHLELGSWITSYWYLGRTGFSVYSVMLTKRNTEVFFFFALSSDLTCEEAEEK